MSNIVSFPTRSVRGPAGAQIAASAIEEDSSRQRSALQIDAARLVVAFFWPVLRWVLAMDVAWHFVRMLLLWNVEGHAGLMFVGHFTVFAGLTWFVGSGAPLHRGPVSGGEKA